MRLSRELFLELGIGRLNQDALVRQDDHRDASGAPDASGLLGPLRVVLDIDPVVADTEAFKTRLGRRKSPHQSAPYITTPSSIATRVQSPRTAISPPSKRKPTEKT